jgi:site-specific DNA-methyltransferase (adenine-specific)
MLDNTLYYGDNLRILRDHIPDNSIDLIYLDPPFNSKADYNILFKEPTGRPSEAQITAFEDTWHWPEAEATFQEIVRTAPANVIEMMTAFRQFVGLNDVMAYLTMMCIRLIELRRVLKPSGSIYLHCDPTASHYLKILMDTIFEKKNFRNEIVWGYSGGGIPRQDFPRKHDIILRYSKSDKYFYRPIYRPFTAGTIARGRTKVKKAKPLAKKGTPLSDWWFSNLECDSCHHKLSSNLKRIASPTDPEKLGYPTQKPVDLLRRIVEASSEKGDVILDPFCGCGTSVIAAQMSGRRWVGIDITHLAINLIKWRLQDMFGLKAKRDYSVMGEPEDLAGAKELASQNRYQFQWWASSLINAKPYGDKRKGADTGIDGYVYFHDEKDKVGKGIAQIKSGKVFVKDIRDLVGVIEREKAEIGILITLEEPTREMKKEAIAAGYYESKTFKGEFPQIQIFTIEDLLAGKKPTTPPSLSVYKNAQRVNMVEQFNIDYDQSE